MEGYLYLGLAVVTTALLFSGLRIVRRFTDDLFSVVVFNYLAAGLTGMAVAPGALSVLIDTPPALRLAVLVGAMFLGLFFLMGLAAQRVGVGYLTIVARMAVAVPVLVSWWAFGEEMTVVRGLGVLLALAAVILVNHRPGGLPGLGDNKILSAVLVLVLFFGNGATDSLFKLFEVRYAEAVPDQGFSSGLFLVAGLLGLAVLAGRRALGGRHVQWRAVLAGLVLGVPNFFSIWLLVKSLGYFDGTFFFPVFNLFLLTVMAGIGWLYFREKFTAWNWAGLALALGAVFLLW